MRKLPFGWVGKRWPPGREEFKPEMDFGHVTSTGGIHFRLVTYGITDCFEGLTAVMGGNTDTLRVVRTPARTNQEDSMIGAVTGLLYVMSLVVGVWVLVKLARNTPVLLKNKSDRALFWTISATEAVVLVQAVVGFVMMFTSDRDIHRLTFGAYLIGLLLLLPIGTWWSLGDRSRGGTAVLLVAVVTLAAMVLRLSQIWAGYA